MHRSIRITLIAILSLILVSATPLGANPGQGILTEGLDPSDTFYLSSGSSYRYVVYESFLRPVT